MVNNTICDTNVNPINAFKAIPIRSEQGFELAVGRITELQALIAMEEKRIAAYFEKQRQVNPDKG